MDAVRKMVARLPAANQRMRYSPVPGGDGALQPHAGRRRRGHHGRATRSRPRAELYMGLVEVGRGPHPRRRRQHDAAAQRLRRPTRRTRTSTRCPSSRRCSSPSAPRRWRPRAEEAREAGLPERRRTASALNRDFLLSRRQGAGAGHGRRRASGRRGPRTSACPGHERRGDHRHDAVRHAAQQPDLRARPEDRPASWRAVLTGGDTSAVRAGDRGAAARAGAGGVPEPRAARRRPRSGSCHMLENGKPLRN